MGQLGLVTSSWSASSWATEWRQRAQASRARSLRPPSHTIAYHVDWYETYQATRLYELGTIEPLSSLNEDQKPKYLGLRKIDYDGLIRLCRLKSLERYGSLVGLPKDGLTLDSIDLWVLRKSQVDPLNGQGATPLHVASEGTQQLGGSVGSTSSAAPQLLSWFWFWCQSCWSSVLNILELAAGWGYLRWSCWLSWGRILTCLRLVWLVGCFWFTSEIPYYKHRVLGLWHLCKLLRFKIVDDPAFRCGMALEKLP